LSRMWTPSMSCLLMRRCGGTEDRGSQIYGRPLVWIGAVDRTGVTFPFWPPATSFSGHTPVPFLFFLQRSAHYCTFSEL
jgi:hypothetical protein